MLNLLKHFFWPTRQQPDLPEVIIAGGSQFPEGSRKRGPSVIIAGGSQFPEGSRKRGPSEAASPVDIKRQKGLHSAHQCSWNLDLEQADYRFSRETLAIFRGSGATVVASRQASLRRQAATVAPQQQYRHRSSSIFGSGGGALENLLLGIAGPHSSRQGESVLRQVTNLPAYLLLKSQPVLSVAATATVGQCVHSTPLLAMADRQPAPSTVAKRPTGAIGGCDDDDDCVITSVEGPKSVAEMFSPCKYLSDDWLDEIKTSATSLKSYMQKVESEETLKMQYWAKRRESDERDLVARVTRNLKLAERELPVVPYKYEEPPPTPPPEPEPEPEVPEFPALSPAQLLSVERAWSRQLPGSEVLAEGFSLRVTREELRSLSGLNWLNDNIVNFYMQLLAARSGPGLPRVHAFSTFFFTKLSSSGYSAVRRWTKKVDIFDQDVLLCPVHLHNNHWTLCIIDIRSRHILFLDSLSGGGGGGDPRCLPLLRQYLADEFADKKGGGSNPQLLDVSEFQLVRETGAPHQENGSDCGVFCCKYADYYCRGREFTFRQAHMPYFRKRTTLEILEKRLLW